MLKNRIMFRVNDIVFERMEKLAKKMGVNLSEFVRVSIGETIRKYGNKAYEEGLIVMDKERLDDFLRILDDRNRELDPGLQRGKKVKEAAEASKRVDELRSQGKDKEADEIVNKRAKKGLYTGYTAWQDDK